MKYNELLWAGTHNSAINLGKSTLFKPEKAELGRYPSEAYSSYQYPVMDQRLSVRDQLDGGIRVLDFEIAALVGTNWTCKDEIPVVENFQEEDSCTEHYHLNGRCFTQCPFIVSHGTLEQSVGLGLGYTFPETLFTSIAAWVKENPQEIVTLYLLVTHGNSAPSSESIVQRMNSTGLLENVWNPDPNQAFQGFPTLGEMRRANKTVLISGRWGPRFRGSHANATDIKNPGETCQEGTPCMEGWDTVTFDQLSPSRAVLGSTKPTPEEAETTVFAIENLSSRRGRDDHNAKYWPLPHLSDDLPYQFGGNPSQASKAANYSHVTALESRWAELLEPYGFRPTWILVDFFNTTTPDGGKTSSRTLLHNPEEGLIQAVNDINRNRINEKYVDDKW
eukprot:g332.t1